MPFVDIENSRQIEFGYGDIKVSGGLLDCEGETIGALVFRPQEEPKPIGHYEKFEAPRKTELSESPVRMIFNKIESIDVIIRALEDVKEYMRNESVTKQK